MTNPTVDTPPAADPAVEEYLRLADQLLGVESGGALPGADTGDVREFYARSAVNPIQSHNEPVRSLHVPMDRWEDIDGSGFLVQPTLVERVIAATPGVGVVLEIGCGEGFNTLHLAGNHPDIRFIGFDLLAAHVLAAREHVAATPNASLAVADFQRLPVGSGAVDVVFSVEAIIHSPDMAHTLGEIRRVLRPGGRLFVIELFRSPRFDTVGPQLQRACAVTERLMAIPGMWSLPRWLETAAGVGLDATATTELTSAALGKLTRIARVGERALTRFTPAASEFKAVLGGLLVCRTMRGGGHGLYAIELTRR